jgi:transcriptional regulator with XRE-family HTH domain
MGFVLRRLMEERGLNAYQLAKRLEGQIERSSVYRLASGVKVKLSPDEIAALCGALGVSPNQLFDHKRGKPPAVRPQSRRRREPERGGAG